MLKIGVLCLYENLDRECAFYQESKFRSEVFKLWVGTQTWVALALSLGRGPFRDPQNKTIKTGLPL